MNTLSVISILYYLFFAVTVVAPFVLIFYSVRHVAKQKPVPANKRIAARTIRYSAFVLSFVYIGVVMYAPIRYFAGGFTQTPAEAMGTSLSPAQQAIAMTGMYATLGFIFLGTIICACILTVCSLEKQKAK